MLLAVGGGALERCDFGRCLVCRLAGSKGRLPPEGRALVHLVHDPKKYSVALAPVARLDDKEGLPELMKGSAVVPIAHKTPMCPAFAFESANHSREDLSVRVGVAVLLESSDGKILLTRRPSRLRSFGGLYVLPGGNLEPDETLVQAGLRELLEETGVHIQDNSNVRPFCLWESTFPLSFEEDMGNEGLTHQHLVIYIHVRAAHISSQDPTPFRPQVSEISELVWVSRQEAKIFLDDEVSLVNEKPSIVAFAPNQKHFDADDWHRQVDVTHEDAEKITLMQLRENVVIGTRFALETFFERQECNIATL